MGMDPTSPRSYTVSIQLIAPASGALSNETSPPSKALVSIQLIAPASGADINSIEEAVYEAMFPFN